MAEYELRQMADGVRALPAFTSARRLTEQLGRSQPWLKIRLQAIIDLVGGDHVAFDPVVDAAAWRWDGEELRKLAAQLKADRAGAG